MVLLVAITHAHALTKGDYMGLHETSEDYKNYSRLL